MPKDKRNRHRAACVSYQLAHHSLCCATKIILDKLICKLVEFEDTQAALYLLRLSFGICRATHFMRTTPRLSGPTKPTSSIHKLATPFSIVWVSNPLRRLTNKLRLELPLEVWEFGALSTTPKEPSQRAGMRLRVSKETCLSREGLLKYLRVAANHVN